MSQSVRGREAIARAGRATRYLLVLTVVLMVALASVFAVLVHRQRALRDGIREDALWAVYQLDGEARGLADATTRALADGSDDVDAAAALTRRYDILYSRLSILDNAKYASFFVDNDRIIATRNEVRTLALGFAPTFDVVAARPDGLTEVDRTALSDLRPALDRLTRLTSELLSFTNASLSAARADGRAEVLRLQAAAAGVVVALIAATLVLVFSLKRQLRLTEAASRELEAIARELTAANVAANAGNRAKSEFMATIGHEIRTPLNAILGMAELLAGSDLPPQERRNVAAILSAGTTLLEMINEILDFTKLEHGAPPAASAPFAPDALAREVARLVEPRARAEGSTLTVVVAPTLRGRRVVGDEHGVRRVLLNLLGNAAKFTADGAIVVRLEEASAGSRLRVSVVDTGIGIAPDAMEKLFKPFSQVDGSIGRRFGGTGLGLAICKRIVENLGGEIGVVSEPGRGSTFWFEVPFENVPVEDGAPAVAPSQGAIGADAASPAQPARQYVLLVEDNAVNRAVGCQFLERLGQRYAVANDGEEAVAAAATERFDLILMDMQMPVLDGIAATRAIRAGAGPNARTPIVAMTANASDSDRQLCFEAGMSGFETKPVSLDRLREVLAANATTAAPANAAGAPLPATPDRPAATVDRPVAGADATARLAAPSPAHRGADVAPPLLSAASITSAPAKQTVPPTAQPETSLAAFTVEASYASPPTGPASPAGEGNEDRRAELVETLGEEGFTALVELFREDAAQLLVDLAEARRSRDAGLYDRTLHSLKGAAANLGFVDLAATAQDLRTRGLADAAAAESALQAALRALSHRVSEAA